MLRARSCKSTLIHGEGATTRNGNTAQLSVKELLSGCRDLMKTLMKAALAEDIEAEMAEFPVPQRDAWRLPC